MVEPTAFHQIKRIVIEILRDNDEVVDLMTLAASLRKRAKSLAPTSDLIEYALNDLYANDNIRLHRFYVISGRVFADIILTKKGKLNRLYRDKRYEPSSRT